jgi:hypothetical protein
MEFVRVLLATSHASSPFSSFIARRLMMTVRRAPGFGLAMIVCGLILSAPDAGAAMK